MDGSRLEAVGALIHWASRNRLDEVMIGLRGETYDSFPSAQQAAGCLLI